MNTSNWFGVSNNIPNLWNFTHIKIMAFELVRHAKSKIAKEYFDNKYETLYFLIRIIIVIIYNTEKLVLFILFYLTYKLYIYIYVYIIDTRII